MMKYILKSHSILGEKIQTLIMGLFIYLMMILMIFLSMKYKNIVGYLSMILFALIALYFTFMIFSIFRNTVDYTITFFDTYFHIKSKKYDFIIEYSQINNMRLKKNFSIMSSGRWLYLEIECGLNSPVYVNYSYVQENKLREITEENFVKHFEKIINWNKIIKPRNKNNIL